MITTLQLYDHLLETQLFQGMSRGDLEGVIGYTKFGFSRYTEGNTIIREGDRCEQLCFLLQGDMEVTTSASDHSYSVTETIRAPYLIQPERLFGLQQIFTSTYKAKTTCNFMTLSKTEVTTLLDNYLVFRINLLNLLASRLQKANDNTWLSLNMSLKTKLCTFFLRHCLYPAGEKTVKIKMTHLADIVGTSRLNVSKELNAMQQQGLLTLSREKIKIHAIEHLFM